MNASEQLEQQVLEILTPEQFKEWLVKRNGWLCGMTRHAFACPLATYIKEKIGVRIVSVSEVNIVGGNSQADSFTINTPPWAGWFICAVDKPPRREVTSKECLEALNTVVS